jgi:hypothetical protein
MTQANITREFFKYPATLSEPSNEGCFVTLDNGNRFLVEQHGGSIHVWTTAGGSVHDLAITELEDLRYMLKIINEAIMVKVGGERK